MKLILASSSPYRRELLQKLGLAFDSISPDLDEKRITSEMQGSSPSEIAEALSIEKAKTVYEIVNNPEALVVAGDQLVSLNGEIFGKPGSSQMAFEQLLRLRGQTHELITALTCLSHARIETRIEVTRLQMRQLSDSELSDYLLKDQPFDCAGSYKIENSGIALFDSIETSDFSAIQGIPMIWLTSCLKEYGYELFKH